MMHNIQPNALTSLRGNLKSFVSTILNDVLEEDKMTVETLLGSLQRNFCGCGCCVHGQIVCLNEIIRRHLPKTLEGFKCRQVLVEALELAINEHRLLREAQEMANENLGNQQYARPDTD